MERLEILKNANLINDDDVLKIKEIISFLKEKIDVENKNMDMLITHVAMYLSRKKTDSKVNMLNEEIKKDVISDENYALSENILSEIEEKILKESIDENEKIYIIMHLEAILGE